MVDHQRDAMAAQWGVDEKRQNTQGEE